MRAKTKTALALILSLTCVSQTALAQEEDTRVYDADFFERFSPQTALEIIERLPGFTLQEAEDNRGLSLGGTNVLINGRPITGKGEAATNQLAQISAESVVRVEISDASTLDLPGYTGLVANIITTTTSLSGSIEWEPEFKDGSKPALTNGSLTLSGSFGNLDASLALNSTAVRTTFVGPETLSTPAGELFETREESFAILGDQPVLSGSLSWARENGHVFNAKASLGRLDIEREQVSLSRAITPRGFSGLNIGAFEQDQSSARFDTDYSLPAFGGSLKLIAIASTVETDMQTRVRVDTDTGDPVSRTGFDEATQDKEIIARFEQSWGEGGQSWQLAGEGVFNALDVDTTLLGFALDDSGTVVSRTDASTTIEEVRGELTLTHGRSLSSRSDLQVSIGAETSTLSQGSFERDFFRPKGFASYTLRPTEDWTLVARVARDVGQINFRDFASSVSLFEQVETANNPELVPQQSWAFTGRAERRFEDGHVASVELEHDRITDLVDRIPLGESGDAVGNIDEATRTRLRTRITVLGQPFGLDGAQLDLTGSWIWSSVEDPIEGFDRDIGGVRLRDIRLDFRHDLVGTPWSYGFSFQELELAPTYRSTLIQDRNVPGGGLTPGENSVFVEHSDVFGLRARVTVSEFLDYSSDLTRTIYDGRRDVGQVDRIEDRSRSLRGPYLGLSIGRTF